jgi:hypothetical protein
MNAVYIRVAVYGLTTLAALIPMAWLNWGVSFDGATHVLTVNLDALGAAAATALAANLGILKKWGIK